MSVLQKEMTYLKELLLAQKMKVQWAISKSITALQEQDTFLAKDVIAADLKIDENELKIEEECLRILLLQHPVATDLRYVVAAFKINTSLERMGDYAANIAKRSLTILYDKRMDFNVNLTEMAEQAKALVKKSLDAFFNQDIELAYQVYNEDYKVDAFRKYFSESIIMEIRRNPDYAESLFELSSLVRHFERLADMATHVSEEVIYLVKGKTIRHGMDE